MLTSRKSRDRCSNRSDRIHLDPSRCSALGGCITAPTPADEPSALRRRDHRRRGVGQRRDRRDSQHFGLRGPGRPRARLRLTSSNTLVVKDRYEDDRDGSARLGRSITVVAAKTARPGRPSGPDLIGRQAARIRRVQAERRECIGHGRQHRKGRMDARRRPRRGHARRPRRRSSSCRPVRRGARSMSRPGGSRPSAPRSSEPHGKRTVTRSATPSKRPGAARRLRRGTGSLGAAARRFRCGSTRGIGHRACVGVDGEDERGGVRGRCRKSRAAVAGAEVDDDPPMPAGQVEDLADVRLVRAAADDGAHGGILSDGQTCAGGSLWPFGGPRAGVARSSSAHARGR